MRSLLGFRPPHFSEEEAWLPAWLQPSTISPSSSSSSSAQEIQQITTGGGNGHDGTLHLFLSGDSMNFPSSSTNHQLQYHLHLSSNQEESLSRSQADKSEPLLVQQPEARVIPEEGALPSQQKGDFVIAHPKSPSFKERCRKVDISDAIELAVAASEALTIHKVLKDELLVASSVLEAAIRLKQARLENLSNSIESSNEVEFDFLSDVDDLTMADAYEDVGLTVDPTGYGSLSIVNDSFASENYTSNAKHKGNECGGAHNDSDSISPKQVYNANILSKGPILESCECVTGKQNVDYESLGTENANLASNVDPVFNCSVEQCAPEVDLQREGFLMTPSHTNSRSNERQDKMTSLVPDRFQSRWFGGWTWKNEVSIPVVTDDNNKRSVPEPFANETSYLSESAPDMSSCMQRQDKDKTVSQSSTAPQHAYEKANDNGDLISDDVAVSPMDPLCSVVPCSFTLDNVVSQNSQHQEHLGPAVEPNLDNLQVNGDSLPTIHRQVASLKTYSMLHPRCEPYVDKEHTSSFEHNQTAAALTSHREKENAKVSRKVESIVPRRKRVRFSETEICYPQVKKFRKTPQTRLKDPLVASRICRRSKSRPCDKDNKMLLQDLTFLLTGFSVKKHKQIKILIQNNGGLVLDDIPSSTSRRKRCSKLPLILCPKKLLTTKFLYGCAINAGILEITWLFDSVDKGLILPHQRYNILNDRSNENHLIFDNIAIMLHGKQDFCSKMGKVIKHGGGSVFKTFHRLVKSLDSKKVSAGVIVMEDENSISRQLKQCALEQKVPVMPFNWIINSLYAGRLLPSPQLKLPGNLIHVKSSEEI